MSLKAINELAAWVKAHYGGAAEELADAAKAEIAVIENAAKVLTDQEVKRALRHAPDDVQDTIEWLESVAKEAE